MLAHAPQTLAVGTSIGLVIYTSGSEEQKKYLPAIVNLDSWRGQGAFSEPRAGSDLAGLKTTAKKDGDYFVIHGQKTWTTLGQHRDMIFMLVRTNPTPNKQQGISFLLIEHEVQEHHCAPDPDDRRRRGQRSLLPRGERAAWLRLQSRRGWRHDAARRQGRRRRPRCALYAAL
ncbi:acyl-CoA dehydrogenase family protein [Bradyrhizobium sp. DASA03007]|uniref:acyl-CoA dehydrogenase family protein n=1 Tax=unclassified Bradyrhizobium TaxID=2631580 RepID=UPI003F716D82